MHGKLIESFIEYDSDSKVYGEPNSYLANELKTKFKERANISNIGLGSKREKANYILLINQNTVHNYL